MNPVHLLSCIALNERGIDSGLFDIFVIALYVGSFVPEMNNDTYSDFLIFSSFESIKFKDINLNATPIPRYIFFHKILNNLLPSILMCLQCCSHYAQGYHQLSTYLVRMSYFHL